jgi:hypothetical protein
VSLLPNTEQNAALEAERVAFEAAVCKRYGYTGVVSRRVGDYYADASLSQAWAFWQARAQLAAQGEPKALRYTFDGALAECPCCGSLDVGGAHDTVSCYGCGLQITKPRPLQNAADAWNKRAQLAAPAGVSAGWRMVPVEPTPEMVEVALKWGTKLSEWRELLAAAPSPAPVVRMCANMQRPVSECGCPDCGSSLIDEGRRTEAWKAQEKLRALLNGGRG